AAAGDVCRRDDAAQGARRSVRGDAAARPAGHRARRPRRACARGAAVVLPFAVSGVSLRGHAAPRRSAAGDAHLRRVRAAGAGRRARAGAARGARQRPAAGRYRAHRRRRSGGRRPHRLHHSHSLARGDRGAPRLVRRESRRARRDAAPRRAQGGRDQLAPLRNSRARRRPRVVRSARPRRRIMTLQAEHDRRRLVLLIQLYALLLVFEGALRKWVFPSLSDPLLLIRDPVAIVICVLGYRSNNLVLDKYMRSLFLLLAGFVAIGALQLINGIGGSPLVIGYGLRTYLLHLPVAFVMARVLNPIDIRRILLSFLWVALPMALLMAMQFESSPAAWVNRSVSGHRGQMFAAPGHIRPPGTFSFVNGPIGFFSIALAALIAGSVERALSWPLRIAGWVAVSLAAAVSGSRSFLAAIAGVMIVGIAGWARGRSTKLGRGLVVSAFTALIALNVLGSFETVRDGAVVIQSRLDQW